MKKLVSGLVIGGILSTCVFAYSDTTSWTANKATFKVMVRGQEYVSETPPIVIDGRTFLPLRAMGEVLGVSVEWNTELKQAEVGMSTNAQKNDVKPLVLSDSEKAMWKKGSWQATKATFKVMVRGQEFVSENPPIVVEGRTFLPLRVLGDALGVKIDWNEQLRQAEVDMAKTTEPVATQAPAVPATTPTPGSATQTPAAATPTPATTSSSSKTTKTPAKTSTPVATPTPAATQISTSTLTPAATPAPATTIPTSTETPAPAKTPEPDWYDEATPAPTKTPAPAKTSEPDWYDETTPAPTKTPAPAKTSEPDWYDEATPAPAKTPAPVATPVSDDDDWYY